LSSNGLSIIHIDKEYKMTRWSLRQVMKAALSGFPDMEKKEAKFNTKLVDKLKYCKEVLTSIKMASGKGEEGEAPLANAGLAPDFGADINFQAQAERMRKGSKASLR
jgi:hypothetical protein